MGFLSILPLAILLLHWCTSGGTSTETNTNIDTPVLAIKGTGSKTFALVNGRRYELYLREDEKGSFLFQKFPDPVVITIPKAVEPFNVSIAKSRPCGNEKVPYSTIYVRLNKTESLSFSQFLLVQRGFDLGRDAEGDYFIVIDSETYPVPREHLAAFCLTEKSYVLVNNSQGPIERPHEVLAKSEDPKIYAFYFPQFHEDDLNTKYKYYFTFIHM